MSSFEIPREDRKNDFSSDPRGESLEFVCVGFLQLGINISINSSIFMLSFGGSVLVFIFSTSANICFSFC